MRALAFLLAFLAASTAWAQSSKVHDLSISTTNPLPAGSCLYVDQNSTDTKLCSAWAATLGALLPDLTNLTATALPSGFTLPSPIFSGTVAGANTIPYSILQQAAQRTLLGNATTGTANITAGWAVSGNASTVATTTGSLTNGHCVDIDASGNFVDAGAACSSGGGGGSVTSVGLSVPAASIFGVTSSPITTAGSISLTTTGTSGGVPYFSSGTQLSSSAQMPANHAITGGGAGASPKDSKVTITIPATGATLTLADGKTATHNATTTFGGVDGKTVAFNKTQTFDGTDATVITFQATDTYVGRATTDTLTNKTYDTAGTGNVFKIAGAQLTAISGTGATVPLTASPTFTGTLTGGLLVSGTAANYAATSQFTGSTSGGSLYIVGTSSVPDTTLVPALVVEKYMNSTATSGVVAGNVTLGTKYGNGSNTRATAGYDGMDDHDGWSGAGSIAFSEARRSECTLLATAVSGSCYGTISGAYENVGATHSYLFGSEAVVINTAADATTTFVNTSTEGSYLATSGGKKVFAAYSVGPFTLTANQFINGFFCPPGSGGNNPVGGACLRIDGTTPWAIDASLGTFSGGFARGPGFSVSGTGAVTATLPTSAGAGGLFVCVDTSGVMYKKAVCP